MATKFPAQKKTVQVLPSLPSLIYTGSGVAINPSEKIWAYRDQTTQVSLNFLKLPSITDEMLLCFKLVLVWYVQNKSAWHLKNIFSRMKALLVYLEKTKTGAIRSISKSDIVSYGSTLIPGDKWYLGVLKGFFLKWHGLRLPALSSDAVIALKLMRIPGNVKGVAVLTMNPEEGPFSDIEREGMQSAVDNAYLKKFLSDEDYLLIYLFMLLGQRSTQYAALKVCDIKAIKGEGGEVIYILNVPRAKQRGNLARTSFKERILIPTIGKLLLEHADDVRQRLIKLIDDPEQAPMFPAIKPNFHAPGFEYHKTSLEVANKLNEAMLSISLHSERTGEPLKITAKRFRYTIGTMAAAEGHSELVIAELLDHQDTQNVQIYVKATPAILERIDRGLAMYMAPFAQAFAGVLIEDESKAIRGNDPSSRIADPRIDRTMKPMGSCGEFGFCGFLAPITCYTCKNFQPWLDGPHEAVLQYLLAERARLVDATDTRIASVRDRTILAVAEVITKCEQIHSNGLEKKNG